jgi:dolichyl-phosphate beta-glucosyltransferase
MSYVTFEYSRATLIPVSKRVKLIVPCYNEELRFDVAAFGHSRLPLLLVNDGSSDNTAAVIERMVRASSESLVHEALHLPRNVGKGEAVRAGLNHALAQGALYVGYLDADLATPLAEAERLLAVLQSHAHLNVVLAIRLARLGSRIGRSPVRHYLGRVFATAAAQVLGEQVYDTQCGCKWFRATAALRDALAVPFVSRWAFDVELLGRLLAPSSDALASREGMREEPLNIWNDRPGSKVTLKGALQAGADLARIRTGLRAYADRLRSR